MGLPLPPDEIKRLQEGLIRNVLIVKRFKQEKDEFNKSLNSWIKERRAEMEEMAKTLKEQGGFDDINIEAFNQPFDRSDNQSDQCGDDSAINGRGSSREIGSNRKK